MKNACFIITDYDTGVEYETVRGLTLDECAAYALEVYCSKPMTAIAILDHKFRTLCIL